MCGIYGIYNFGNPTPVNLKHFEEMGSLLYHRGPDDGGSYINKNIAIGQRRLSIIDIEGGRQPITNESGNIFLVCNGEIYNYKELTASLIKKGHKFKTKTDSEVILHLYEDYGFDCLTNLRGMFTFALWDSKKERFFAARDRLGKKPLNFAVKNGQFVFASELRPILKTDISKELNLKALDSFLSLQYIPSPMTVYKNISQLQPAHFLTIEKGQVKTKQYWDLPLNKKTKMPLTEVKEKIVSEFEKSVSLRLNADVEVGAFLSGGVDSAIVTATAAKLMNKPLKTFTIGFEEEEFSENKQAKKTANFFGADHSEFIIKSDTANILPDLVRHYGQPFADPSALPVFYLAKETSKFVKTALNGDGGDENFAGYMRYPAMRLAKTYLSLPAPIRKKFAFFSRNLLEKNAPYGFNWRLKRFLNSCTGALADAHLNMSSFFNHKEKQFLYSDNFKNQLGGDDTSKKYIEDIFKKTENLDFVNKLLYTDIKSYLPECLLTKIDIATMANSLEARSPFLDHKFMEFVFGLQGNLKLKGFNTKWILRETYKNKLPPEIFNRKKMGFGIPLGKWFRGGLKNYWQETCLSEKALSRGYFKPDSVKTLWNQHQSGKYDHGYKLWALLILETWHQVFDII